MGEGLLFELIVILVLILANGFFAGAEIAIIAAGRGRLRQQAEAGNHGAKLALDLAENPGRFLPTVQVGISFIGAFAAAFAGDRVAEPLAGWLAKSSISWIAEANHEIALTLVVIGVTFFSVLLGELVPKRMALLYANTLAGTVALPMTWLSRIARPAVFVLSKATDVALWVLGSHGAKAAGVSLDDIQHMIETGSAEGVVDPVERQVAVEALKLGDRTCKQVMRPRVDMDALEVDTPPQEVLGALAMAGFSRLPIYEESLDQILGYIHLKDIVRQQYMGWAIDLRKLMHPALFVPESMTLDRLLLRFQAEHNQLAIVLDEFGGTAGMVTLEDVVEELVGEIRSEVRGVLSQDIVTREDGSWLVDGQVSVDDFFEQIDWKHPEATAPRNFSTLAGLLMAKLNRIPHVGEAVTWLGLKYEVVDMDGPRIDRLLISREMKKPS